ncbi:MAG: hypothetical protein JXA96_07735 [Sedimentisphaerales bacterium]|nr:hypothetical protein [Sedimentisphaerales bacterium]
MKKKSELKNKGTVLPLVMIVVIILLTIGSSLISMSFTNRTYSFRESSSLVARCAADAGITQALFEMNKQLASKSLMSDTIPLAYDVSLSNSNAIYSYVVTGSLAGGYSITSIGKSGNSQRMIKTSLELSGLFDHAILTKDSLILKADTIIDGYNSKNPTATDFGVKIGTQSTQDDKIVLNNSVIVDGDIAVGVNGNTNDVIKDLGAKINGDTYASTSKEPLPDVIIPALPNMGTSLSVKSGTLTIDPSDNGTYSSIDLQNGKNIGKLEITGGDVVLHVTGDINLGNNCEIVIADGSTLKVYIDGNISCDNGSGINTEAPPDEASTLQLFATGEGTQYLDVKAKSDWTGTIYAPNGDVILYAGGDVYGAIVADSFELKNGGDFHYDAALKDVTIYDPGVRFVITKWNESIVYSDIKNLEPFNSVDIGVLQDQVSSNLK